MIRDKSELKRRYTSCNYLEDPVITAFYFAKEVRAYYESIKHAYPRRDYHEVAIAAFENFLSLAMTSNAVDMLNKCIFDQYNDDPCPSHSDNADRDAADQFLSGPSIEAACPIGYSLLKLNEPISLDGLKTAYRRASMAHHPDRGGSHVDMVEINKAYRLIHNVLCSSAQSDINSPVLDAFRNDRPFFAPPSKAEDFVYLTSVTLAEIYCDEWDINRAYYRVEALRSSGYHGSKMPERTGNEIYRLIEVLSTLAKRLCKAGRRREATKTLDFAKHIYKVGELDNREYIDQPEKVLSGDKSLRVILKHPRQVRNALEIDVINVEKHNQLMEKFRTYEQIIQSKEQLVDVFLEKGAFVELPFDRGVNTRVRFKRYIPEIDYFEDNKIVNLDSDQQAEYLRAFSNKTSLSLIKKYTYVRLASYLMSLQPTIKEELLDAMISECQLLKELYNDGARDTAATMKRVSEIIEDLLSLKRIECGRTNEKLEAIASRYEQLLADHSEDLVVEI